MHSKHGIRNYHHLKCEIGLHEKLMITSLVHTRVNEPAIFTLIHYVYLGDYTRVGCSNDTRVYSSQRQASNITVAKAVMKNRTAIQQSWWSAKFDEGIMEKWPVRGLISIFVMNVFSYVYNLHGLPLACENVSLFVSKPQLNDPHMCNFRFNVLQRKLKSQTHLNTFRRKFFENLIYVHMC